MIISFCARWGYGSPAPPDQSLSGGVWTTMTYDEISVDSHDFNIAGDGTLVIPYTGYYLIDAQVRASTNQLRLSRIMVNGDVVQAGRMGPAAGSPTDNMNGVSQWYGCLDEGDVVEIQGSVGGLGFTQHSYGHALIQRIPLPFAVFDFTEYPQIGTVTWNPITDIYGWHNGSTLVTVPEDGMYFVAVWAQSESGAYSLNILKNGSSIPHSVRAASFNSSVPMVTVLDLAQGDTVSVYNNGASYIAADSFNRPMMSVFKVPDGTPACVLRNSVGINIAQQNEKLMTFDTEEIDTNGFHSTVSSTGRITIPSGLAGTYLIWAGFQMGAFIAIHGSIRFNSDTPNTGEFFWAGGGAASTSSDGSMMPIYIAELNDGDFVSLMLGNNYNNPESAVNLRFGLIRLDDFTFVEQTCPFGIPEPAIASFSSLRIPQKSMR